MKRSPFNRTYQSVFRRRSYPWKEAVLSQNNTRVFFFRMQFIYELGERAVSTLLYFTDFGTNISKMLRRNETFNSHDQIFFATQLGPFL